MWNMSVFETFPCWPTVFWWTTLPFPYVRTFPSPSHARSTGAQDFQCWASKFGQPTCVALWMLIWIGHSSLMDSDGSWFVSLGKPTVPHQLWWNSPRKFRLKVDILFWWGYILFIFSIYIYIYIFFLSWAAIIDAGVVLYNMVANKYNTNRLHLTKCASFGGIMNVNHNKWLWVNWYQTHQMSNHSPPR